MPGNDPIPEFVLPLVFSGSSAAHFMSNTLIQHHQGHGHADSTDEDDDGGVAIPSTTTTSPLLNAENIPLDFGFAQAAPSIHYPAHPEAVSGDEPIPMLIDNLSPDVPTAMSQLSQQLAQIQEAQGTDLGAEMFGYIGSVHHNSTPPALPFFPPHISTLSEAFYGEEEEEEMYAGSDNGSVSIADSTTAMDISQMYPPPMAEMHNATAAAILPLFQHFMFPEEHFEAITLNSTDLDEVEVDQNSYTLSMYDFLWAWANRHSRIHTSNKKLHRPNIASLQRQRMKGPKQVRRCELQGNQYDIQGMNWLDMDVTRQEARQARKTSYRNYESVAPRSKDVNIFMPPLPNVESFLRFRRMDLQHKPHLSHFQLRNLIACTSQSNVFFAGKHKVHHTNPLIEISSTIMDLSDPDSHPSNLSPFYSGVQISTIAAKHDILLAGGFNGEYGMINLRSTKDSGHVGGLITDSLNSITNHISLSLSRSSGLPQATFASNDNGIRLLDCTTNKLVATHTYPFPVNCTAISPDSRLRVIVGDTKSVYICNTETGATLQELEGHSDFGFACAWADNGWHVATGNQDMKVKIWDARMWTDRHGNANPLTTISNELAGVRSLQFSPLGSGKRILLACEAADVIDVIDAESYESKQVLDFFGEIGGACFTPDGQDVFVANCDNLRGGILEFERTGEGARMGYQSSRAIVEEINRDVARRKTRASLNGERDSDINLNHISNSRSTEEAAMCDRGAVPRTHSTPMDYEVEWESSIETSTSGPEVTSTTGKFEERNGLRKSPRKIGPSKQQTAVPWPQSMDESLRMDACLDFEQLFKREQEKMISHDAAAGGAGSTAADNDDEDIFDSDDDGEYTSVREAMRQSARGYDWRQTDAQVISDSRSNGRTLTWQRRKHLFADGGMGPLMGGGDGAVDIGL